MPVLLTAYYRLAYYTACLLFGGFGAGLTVFCCLAAWLPATPRTERFFQWLIHRHFALFVWWITFTRVCCIHYHGWEHFRPGPPGLVMVANHPTLVDATLILARVRAAICIFKPAIRRNPVLGAAARRAGYLANDGGPDLVRQASASIAGGSTLIVFPEGTRTRGDTVNAFRPGFVLMARRSGAPIQAVWIESDSNILRKSQPMWRAPQLPANIHVHLGPAFSVPPEANAAELAAEIEAWFRAQGVAHAGAHRTVDTCAAGNLQAMS